MGAKRYKPEETIGKLREAEVLLAEGVGVGEVVRRLGVTQVTYYRWRKEYGGMKVNQANLRNLTLRYGLKIEDARDWRLYISSGYNETPLQFSESGLFLVRAIGELYFSSNLNSPFGRPQLDEMLLGIDYAVKTDSPARGDVAAPDMA